MDVSIISRKTSSGSYSLFKLIGRRNVSDKPKLSPQQINPLTPKSAPRNKQGQILNKQNKPTGSKQPQFYDAIEDNPQRARYALLQSKIQEFRVRGRLWLEPEEDPEVQEVLDEFDKLEAELHPQLGDPLSFHQEKWEEEHHE